MGASIFSFTSVFNLLNSSILLFRNASNVLNIYGMFACTRFPVINGYEIGRAAIGRRTTGERKWIDKYKGYMLCLYVKF
jgi:hypothetical protein